MCIRDRIGPGDEVVLVTAQGMAIRFRESDARPMGRNTSGVKGISLIDNDHVVGMVVADPNDSLLTICENGYGKRTKFGPNAADANATDTSATDTSATDASATDDSNREPNESDDALSSSARYRTQKRGGKGLRDIRTSDRNGQVIGIARVNDEDEIFMMTGKGKLQRIKAADINVIGRNTQGVRIMNVDEGDNLIAVVRVPAEEASEEEETSETATQTDQAVGAVESTDASPASDAPQTGDDASPTDPSENDETQE